MYDPNKRLGEDDPPKKRSGFAMAIKFDPSKRLGDDDDEGEGEKEDAGGGPDKLMDDACTGICKALNVSTSAAPRLRQYLEAFVHAADSKPHNEGEHTQDSDDEEGN